MKRVNLDTATADIKEFVRGLPIDGEGVELELDGEVVCEVLPPQDVSPAQAATLIARAREIAAQSRERNKGIPARVLERTVVDALDEVRHQQQR